jgi:hypothetical protein
MYIVPISTSKWDRWREDWVIVRAHNHHYLVLPTKTPTGKRGDWEEVPRLQRAFEPMIERIKHLVGHGPTSMVVLSDFLSKRIAPLQLSTCPTWMYSSERDTTRLGRGRGSDLDPDVVALLLPGPVFG